MTILERVLQILAAITTLGNVVFALALFVLSQSSRPDISVPEFPLDSVIIRLLLFIVLETVISTVFAYAYAFLSGMLFKWPVPGVLGLFVVFVLSPWTSIFNIRWMLTRSGSTEFESFFGFAIGILIANLMFTSIAYLINEDNSKGRDEFSGTFIIHGIAFGIVGILLYIDN